MTLDTLALSGATKGKTVQRDILGLAGWAGVGPRIEIEIGMIGRPAPKVEIDPLQQRVYIMGVVSLHHRPGGRLVISRTPQPQVLPGRRELAADAKVLRNGIESVAVKPEIFAADFEGVDSLVGGWGR